MCVGLVQSVESLEGTKRLSKREFSVFALLSVSRGISLQSSPAFTLRLELELTIGSPGSPVCSMQTLNFSASITV